MGLTKGAISKLAERLLAKGLLEKENNTTDARTHTLAITLRGRAIVPQLATLADTNDTACFAVLTRQEHTTLAALLRKLATANGLTTHPVT